MIARLFRALPALFIAAGSIVNLLTVGYLTSTMELTLGRAAIVWRTGLIASALVAGLITLLPPRIWSLRTEGIAHLTMGLFLFGYAFVYLFGERSSTSTGVSWFLGGLFCAATVTCLLRWRLVESTQIPVLEAKRDLHAELERRAG